MYLEYLDVHRAIITNQPEKALLYKLFHKIQTDTKFKTLIVEYNNNINIEITYESKDVYFINSSYYLNTIQANTLIKKINKIISIKLQAIVCNLNYYGYPEIFNIKVL
jgi:hypothetical protein